LKKLFLLMVFGLFATSAAALPRYDSQSLTCSSIHDKIAQDGAVVLQYPSRHAAGVMMYDRYVSGSNYCTMGWSMASRSVPASDNPDCKVRMCSSMTGKGPTHH
jgi:hypothetical protein